MEKNMENYMETEVMEEFMGVCSLGVRIQDDVRFGFWN